MRDTRNYPMGLSPYPRGFLGAAAAQDEREDPCLAVEKLYHQYINDRQAGNCFDFREDVFKAALAVFGTKTFQQWYEAQFSSACVTDLHIRFLDDTLTFIRTGKREMSLENWASLIKSGVGAGAGKMSEQARNYFAIGKSYSYDSTWPGQLQDWCTSHGGFEDLLNFLHICFGGTHC